MSLGVSVPSFSVSEYHYHQLCVLVAVNMTGVRANRGYSEMIREEKIVNAQWWTKKKES